MFRLPSMKANWLGLLLGSQSLFGSVCCFGYPWTVRWGLTCCFRSFHADVTINFWPLFFSHVEKLHKWRELQFRNGSWTMTMLRKWRLLSLKRIWAIKLTSDRAGDRSSDEIVKVRSLKVRMMVLSTKIYTFMSVTVTLYFRGRRRVWRTVKGKFYFPVRLSVNRLSGLLVWLKFGSNNLCNRPRIEGKLQWQQSLRVKESSTAVVLIMDTQEFRSQQPCPWVCVSLSCCEHSPF